jgi:hypothetical protein
MKDRSARKVSPAGTNIIYMIICQAAVMTVGYFTLVILRSLLVSSNPCCVSRAGWHKRTREKKHYGRSSPAFLGIDGLDHDGPWFEIVGKETMIWERSLSFSMISENGPKLFVSWFWSKQALVSQIAFTKLVYKITHHTRYLLRILFSHHPFSHDFRGVLLWTGWTGVELIVWWTCLSGTMF